eukprot:14108885-Heterocapsa_arctica.AAC.1
MRAPLSDFPGQAGAEKPKARSAYSSVYFPEAPGRQPGKPKWQGKAPRPGNALSVGPKDGAAKKPQSADGGIVLGGNCLGTHLGISH